MKLFRVGLNNISNYDMQSWHDSSKVITTISTLFEDFVNGPVTLNSSSE